MDIPEKYQAEIEVIISMAREFLSEGRELQAFVFLGKPSCSLLPCPMNMSSGSAKDMSAAMVRELAKVLRAEYAIMISEAWALDHTKTSMEEAKRIASSGRSIANHPDCTDVVMITLETLEGFWIAQTTIKPTGKGRGFDDPCFNFMAGREGRFASFLPPQGPIH